MKTVIDEATTYKFDKKRFIALCNDKVDEKENEPEMDLSHFNTAREMARLLIVEDYQEQDFFSKFSLTDIQNFADCLINWPDYNLDEEYILEHPIAQMLFFKDIIFKAKNSKNKKRSTFI